MDALQIETTVRRIIGDMCLVKRDASELRRDLSLRNDLGFDSLTLVSLLLRLQEEFGLGIADVRAQLAGAQTVDAVVTGVLRLRRSESDQARTA